jgi:hypothetical protein
MHHDAASKISSINRDEAVPWFLGPRYPQFKGEWSHRRAFDRRPWHRYPQYTGGTIRESVVYCVESLFIAKAPKAVGAKENKALKLVDVQSLAADAWQPSTRPAPCPSLRSSPCRLGLPLP